MLHDFRGFLRKMWNFLRGCPWAYIKIAAYRHNIYHIYHNIYHGIYHGIYMVFNMVYKNVYKIYRLFIKNYTVILEIWLVHLSERRLGRPELKSGLETAQRGFKTGQILKKCNPKKKDLNDPNLLPYYFPTPYIYIYIYISNI